MNDEFWTSGVIKSNQGPIAWPGMTKKDAEWLPPLPTPHGFSSDMFLVTGVVFSDTPFTALVVVREKERAGVQLCMDRDFSQAHYGEEFPLRQEMLFYEGLFQQFLGSAKHEHQLSWGRITIGEDPWTRDPFIAVWY